VQDEVVHGELEKTDGVLQNIEVSSAPTLDVTPYVAHDNVTQVDESQPIPETQNLVVANDDNFDEVARQDIALVTKACADMAEEQPFTQ
jgi:cytochrome c